MWASLEVMARAAACVAQLETGAGEVTLRWLGDLELVATAAAAGNLTVGLWMDGWHAAWITRDHLALEALARVPPSTVTGPVAHPFAEPLIGALQAFHRGDDAAPELALEALKKTDPAGIVDGVDEILATTVPFLDAFYRVMAMDEPTFQAKLIHAVEQWRTWYQGGNRGAYSRALAGLCARVHDGGLVHRGRQCLRAARHRSGRTVPRSTRSMSRLARFIQASSSTLRA